MSKLFLTNILMNLSVIIFENDFKNIDYALKNIDAHNEYVFVVESDEGENNINFLNYSNYSNVWVLTYKKYSRNNIKNFILGAVSNDHLIFMDLDDFYKMDILKYLTNLINDQEVIIIDISEEKYLKFNFKYMVYSKKFLINNELFFNKNIEFMDYFFGIKTIIKAEKIDVIKVKDNILVKNLKDKTAIFNNIFMEVIDRLNYVFYNQEERILKKFVCHIIEILNFLNSKNMTKEIIYFKEIYNCYNFNEEIYKNMLIELNSTVKHEEKSKNLFIIHTPYHILLAISICLSHKYIDCENEILINNSFSCEKWLIDRLKCIFKKVYIHESNEPEIPEDIENIYKNFKNKLYDNIFVNNESEIKTQFIINYNLKENGKLIYVEDGTANYRNLEKEKINTVNTRYYLDYVQMYVESSSILGTHSRISEGYFIYPELIMKELKNNRVLNSVDCNLLKDAIKLIYPIYDFGKDEFILIALEHSFFAQLFSYNLDEYINMIKNIMIELNKIGKKVYVKYHPREKKEYIDFDFESCNVSILDKNLAIESIFCKNMILISLRSTSLVTFSKLFTPKKAICIQNLIEDSENELTDLFKEIGMEFPSTIDELIFKLNS